MTRFGHSCGCDTLYILRGDRADLDGNDREDGRPVRIDAGPRPL
jgi:hypothetical protein